MKKPNHKSTVRRWVAAVAGLMLLILFVGLTVARPWLIRRSVERALVQSLEADIVLGAIDSSLRQSRVSIHDLRISNPAAWPTPVDLLIREITVNYDWRSLLSSTVRLRTVVLDIQEVNVVMDMDGLTQLQKTATGHNRRSPAPSAPSRAGREESTITPARPESSAPAPAHSISSSSRRDFHIELLEFRLGRINMYNALFGEVDDEAIPIILNLEQSFYDVEDLDRVLEALTRSLLFAMPSVR